MLAERTNLDHLVRVVHVGTITRIRAELVRPGSTVVFGDLCSAAEAFTARDAHGVAQRRPNCT